MAPPCAVAALLATLSGCTLFRARPDNTTVITPSMRAATIRDIGGQVSGYTEAQQVALCEQLAQQIRIEPDPIVRQTIQNTIAECKTPMAKAVVLAGLNDDNADVRRTCCRLLGRSADPESIPALSRVVAMDADQDVRLSAVKSLGGIKGAGAIQGLAAALNDRDPALQYAGVEAMKNASGQNLGNDVEAWRQYAASQGAGRDQQPAANLAAQPSEQSVK
jgi:HEAT repeat protein